MGHAYGCHAFEIGGVENLYIHLLVSLSRTLPLGKFIKEVKKGSFKWIKNKWGGITFDENMFGIR